MCEAGACRKLTAQKHNNTDAVIDRTTTSLGAEFDAVKCPQGMRLIENTVRDIELREQGHKRPRIETGHAARQLAPTRGAGVTLNQNVRRICNSSLRLLAFSEKIAFPEPAGWFACPNSGEAMLPMIGPGLL